MATVASRLIELLLRNLKSDAVPKAPRPDHDQSDSSNLPDEPETRDDRPRATKEQSDEDDHEEIVFGEDDFINDSKKKFKFPFKSKKNKDDPKVPKGSKHEKTDKRGSINSVNTQATGAVFNVVNSTDVQFGSNTVYYMSATKKQNGTCDDENQIQKDNLIILLMESDIEPTPKYISFVSKNLGLNWKTMFTSMGYLKGRIDTLVEENGITEARYQLLHDWVNNKDDATLGRLAQILWDEGERQIVRELSLIYKENKK